MKPLTSAKTHNRNRQDSTQKQGEVLKPKRFSEKEKQLYHKVFYPKIKHKTYKKRSVKKTCEDLVASFFPSKKVSYAAMNYRLFTQFDRCNRKTILDYLGRPKTHCVQKVAHTIQAQTGSRAKSHVFARNLPAKIGYVQKYGLATLETNTRTGETWFILHHKEQTKIDEVISPHTPHSEALEEVSQDEFASALSYAKAHPLEIPTLKKYIPRIAHEQEVCETSVLQRESNTGTDGEERETYTRKIIFEVGESKLSAEEKRLFNFYDSVTEASR